MRGGLDRQPQRRADDEGQRTEQDPGPEKAPALGDGIAGFAYARVLVAGRRKWTIVQISPSSPSRLVSADNSCSMSTGQDPRLQAMKPRSPDWPAVAVICLFTGVLIGAVLAFAFGCP